MSELPQNPELLIEDDAESFDFGGARSAESFELKEPSSVGVSLPEQGRHVNWMVDVVIPLAMLAAGGLILAAAIKFKATAEQLPPTDNTRVGILRSLPAVDVERVNSLESMGDGFRFELQVDGTVVPYREAKVATEVSGNVVFKDGACEAGSYVQKGHVLMRIDPTDYELEIERLTRVKGQEYEAIQEVIQERANTEKLIEIAEQDLELQNNEVERQRKLRDKKFASDAEVDNAIRLRLQAVQQLTTLKNQRSLLEKRQARLESSEKVAAAQLRAAEINVDRCVVRAPISGVIVAEDAEINTFVTRGSPLFTIEDTSRAEVATSLRMDQLYWVLDHQEAETTAVDAPIVDEASGGDPGVGYKLPKIAAVIEYELAGRNDVVYRWEGELTSYDGIGLDPTTRTVPVRVVVNAPQKYIDQSGKRIAATGPTPLVRGMYVRVSLQINPKTRLVVIPAKALRPGNRVWQFERDPSLIEPRQSDEEEPGEDDSESRSQQPSDEELTEEELEQREEQRKADQQYLKDWASGTVKVRHSITPVDALTVGQPREKIVDRFTSQPDRMDRLWVCEDPGGAIKDGEYVVTSPLGLVGADTVSARALTESLDGNTDSTDEAGATHDAAKSVREAPTDPSESDRPSESNAPSVEAAE